MTLKELSQLYYLQREIKADRRRLEELREKASGLPAQKFNGMPSGSGCASRVERDAADIIDLEGIIESKLQQCIHERNRLERYIADIPDSQLRQIFTLRFVGLQSWIQVALTLGGGNTAASVKMACYRYLKRIKK